MESRAARDAAMRAFLAAQGWGAAGIEPLAQDASFRRYWRLRNGSGSAVLMDAPPPQENVRPFMSVAGLLDGYGYSVPRVRAADIDGGFLLLDDLGDATYTRALATGAAGADAAVAGQDAQHGRQPGRTHSLGRHAGDGPVRG